MVSIARHHIVTSLARTAVLALLWACAPLLGAPTFAETAPTPTPTPTRPDPDISAFVDWLDGQIVEQDIPGAALAIVSRDRTLHLQTWGVSNLADPQAVTPEALFRIASMSKTFAGAATAMLVERGIYQWDTRLIDIFPDLKLGTRSDSREITLRHVLSQSTGLMPHAFSNLLDAGIDYKRIKRRLQEIPTVCRPGDCYGYQNVVFSLAADVVEEATGESYAEFVQRELFAPLGMRSASVGFEPYRSSPQATAPHQRLEGRWHVVETNPAYYSVAPASGINASIIDMSIWVQANLGGRPDVLPPEFLAATHRPVTAIRHGSYFNRWSSLEGAYYALGWRVFDIAGVRVVHHGGSVRGYRSEMALLPEAGVGVVVLLNAESRVANDVVPAFVSSMRPDPRAVQSVQVLSSAK